MAVPQLSHGICVHVTTHIYLDTNGQPEMLAGIPKHTISIDARANYHTPSSWLALLCQALSTDHASAHLQDVLRTILAYQYKSSSSQHLPIYA